VQLVDANVLLYAVNERSAHHAAARDWLDGSFNDGRTIGFAWVVLLAFLRLSTRAGVFPRPLQVAECTDVIASWLRQRAAVTVPCTDRHLALVTGLLREVGTAANLVNDAHLAALALEHGAEIVSFDGDFARFAGVRWSLPA
jgi:toxin-antitoxin system PIN domain toxin